MTQCITHGNILDLIKQQPDSIAIKLQVTLANGLILRHCSSALLSKPKSKFSSCNM